MEGLNVERSGALCWGVELQSGCERGSTGSERHSFILLCTPLSSPLRPASPPSPLRPASPPSSLPASPLRSSSPFRPASPSSPLRPALPPSPLPASPLRSSSPLRPALPSPLRPRCPHFSLSSQVVVVSSSSDLTAGCRYTFTYNQYKTN